MSDTIIIDKIKNSFAAKFGNSEKLIISIAPGRVNLIGDHTDYNEGFVFPMTIDCALYVAIRRRNDDMCRIYTENFNEEAMWQVAKIKKTTENHWSNYIKGVMYVLLNKGYKLGGFDAIVYGDVPAGASLSSSAALEIAILEGLRHLFNLEITPIDAIKLAQQAENEFVGMHCGIMDQFVSRLGKKGHAIFLDCRSLEYKNVPLNLDGYAIIIVNSKVKRALVNSAYNVRRASCEEAVRCCQRLYPHITSLRDVDMQMLSKCRAQTELSHESWCRARHVINENRYVLDAVTKLENGDMSGFGALLYASHASLRDDYATSCKETDHIVAIAQKYGALGARITGAGFGGCVVVLARAQNVAHLQNEIARSYTQTFDIVPTFMPVTTNREAEIVI